jgi:hypothetical protein
MSTLACALRHRRFLISAWPWRSLAYVLTSAAVAAPLAAVVWTLGLPWLVAATGGPDRRVFVLAAVGVALLAGFGPLVAVPLGALERRRLELLDDRAPRSAHRPAPGGPTAWLRVRLTEAATWREMLYGLFVAIVVPVGYGLLGFAALLVGAFVASPLVAANGPAYWQLGPWEITGVAESVPVALLGAALVPVLAYLVGLAAAGQRAVAHALLGDAPR